MHQRTLKLTLVIPLLLLVVQNSDAAEQATATAPTALAQGVWRASSRVGSASRLFREFTPKISEVDWEVIEFAADALRLRGGPDTRAVQLQIRRDLRSGLPGGIVFDLHLGEAEARGALYVKDDSLQLRFPFTATCSRSGALFSFARDNGKRTTRVSVSGQLVPAEHTDNAGAPHLAVGDIDYRLEFPKSALYRAAVKHSMKKSVGIDGWLQVRTNGSRPGIPPKTTMTIQVAALRLLDTDRQLIESSPNGAWQTIMHNGAVDLVHVVSGKTRRVMNPLDAEPASSISSRTQVKFSDDGLRCVATCGLEHKTILLTDLRHLPNPQAGWLTALDPIDRLPRDLEGHTLELLRSYSPNGKFASYNIHAYGKSAAIAIAFFAADSGAAIAAVPLDDVAGATVTYAPNGSVAVIEQHDRTWIVRLDDGSVMELRY